MKKTLIKLSLLGSLALVGCATPKVSYVDPNAVTTINTNFSQQDLDRVAQNMATNLIQSGKMNQCKSYTLSTIKNSTDQYIDTSSTTSSVSDQLSQSSAITATDVGIVGSLSQNQDAEMNNQQSGKYDDSTTVKQGKMVAADCRLDGVLRSDSQTNGKQTQVTYSFSMQLIKIQQGVIIWRKTDKIAKGLN